VHARFHTKKAWEEGVNEAFNNGCFVISCLLEYL
jgi:hypothetical protein